MLLTVIMSLVVYVLVAYLLALFDICFTLGKEGAAKAVVRGGNVFDHMLMWWSGFYLNDPRKLSFNRAERGWEVLCNEANPNARHSQYAWWQIHWKLLELFGIYWYGLYPFKQIYVYEFQWTEQTVDDNGKTVPWHRLEETNFIYVKNFAYWIKLEAAEDADNEPLDLDYLLTIHINNPYVSLFRNDSWLGRLTADANNKAKVYVGCRPFDDIKRESTISDETMSDFSNDMVKLNDNLLTEPGVKGTKISYGATINAASMDRVATAGVANEEIERALSAKIIAEHTADAEVAKAKGDAKARRVRAKGEADAIGLVYDKVHSYGELGVTLQQLDTLKQAGSSPGSTIVWANNPLSAVSDWFGGKSGAVPTPPPPPAPAPIPATAKK